MSITINGTQLVLQDMHALEQKIDPNKVAREVANIIFVSMEESFETQRDPGRHWSALKPKTVEAKKRKRLPSKLLWSTGRMQKSTILKQLGFGEFMVGVNATSKGYFYPAVHQFGSKKSPKRSFLPIGDEGLAPRVQQEIASYLAKRF